MAEPEPFWTATCSNYLDFPSLRERFRSDLSRGMEQPITLEYVRQIAPPALGFAKGEVAWFDDEISRPMFFLTALWAAQQFPGIPHMDARHFGMVIAEACGDSAFGPVKDPRAPKAWDIIQAMRHWNDPIETLSVLDRLTELYFNRKASVGIP